MKTFLTMTNMLETTKPVNTDRPADILSKEVLNKIFEEDVARAVFYLRI